MAVQMHGKWVGWKPGLICIAGTPQEMENQMRGTLEVMVGSMHGECYAILLETQISF